MWHEGARAALVLNCLFLAACGARILDVSSPDSGTENPDAGMGTGGATGTGTTAGGSGASTGSGGSGASTGTGASTGSGGSGGTPGSGGVTGGVAGSSGTGGAPAPYVTTSFRDTKITKVDLLFMIDNSSSMADKQGILASAVPELVDQLIEPNCVDQTSGKVVGRAMGGKCAAGVLAFEPIKDIHIGVISSSLGSHGAPGVCDDAIDIRAEPHNNDRAHLLTRGLGGANIPTFSSKGFLFYNPNVAGALTSSSAVATPFTDLVKGVGQHGCGYEASLESVHRFLIDPEPYDTIAIDRSIGGFGQAELRGTDQALLQQRADFLRPDSLVSVVLLTDENDCSIVDGGQGFYAILPPTPGTGRSILKGGTSKCRENPNDPCCFNCGQTNPPSGCAPADADPECQKGELSIVEDAPNLRCFNQKQRYGQDFLYPVQRYIDGFTNAQVPNRRGDQMVPNPLFSDLTCPLGGACVPPRDPRRVLVTGIVGVPWQDIAVDPANLAAGYKTGKQLRDENVWANIVGDPLNPRGPVPPRDPHMIESIVPRPGLAGPTSGPNADPVHGHEWDPTKDTAQPNADLQYACTFDLAPPRVCTQAADCDCFGPDLGDVKNPLCQNPEGTYGTTQLRGKAYPGTRILQVLQGLGDQAIVGSICAAQSVDRTRQDFGYAPAVSAVVNRLRKPLAGECLPIALPVDGVSGAVPCSIIEVFNDASCNCDNTPARRTAPEGLLTEAMKAQGACHCEIKQLTGQALSACQAGIDSVNPGDGWCYVDPAQQSGASCDLVKSCTREEERRIRFINANSEPRPSAAAYLRCEKPPILPAPARCP